LIKAGGKTICCEVHKLLFIFANKEELPEEWKESNIVPIHKKGDKTDLSMQLLNVHEDNDIRQAEIHTVEPLVPEKSAFEVELAIGKLKNHI